MKKTLIILFSFIFVFSCGNKKNETELTTSKEQQTKKQKSEYQEFIELHSAAHLAKESGTTEMWVIKNLKINLWQKESSQGKGRKVGELLPGSRALIISKGKDDYKVESPYDNSIGWINKIQVKRTLIQNIHTFEELK